MEKVTRKSTIMTTFRQSPIERSLLDELSAKLGLSRSEFIRAAISSEIKRTNSVICRSQDDTKSR